MKRIAKFYRKHWFFLFFFLALAPSAWAVPKEAVILAFGDSITYGMGSSSDGPQTGYPILLERKLADYFPEKFTLVNVGIPGEDTYVGLDRFKDVLNKVAPDLVLLMEGTNDCVFNTPPYIIESNLRAMIQIARDKGIPVILATIPPVITNDYADRSDQMANIQAFNPRIYAIASDFNIRVAQVYEAITSVPGWENALMDQPSANHPNDAGYLLVRDAFFNQASFLLNSGGLEVGRFSHRYTFNAGKQEDLLWQNAQSGEFYTWLMNGTSINPISSINYLGTVSDSNWKIKAIADFTGEGKTDILWQHSQNGMLYLWVMNGTSIVSIDYVGTVSDLNWRIKEVADFNGDGKADILWEHIPTGTYYVWLMNGTSIKPISSINYLYTVGDSNWKIKDIADFNGDGKADILWEHIPTGTYYVWLMNGASILSINYLYTVSDPNWKIQAVADFTADGKADVLWRHNSTGMLYLWVMKGTTSVSIDINLVGTVSDLNWKIREVADFNGDSKADILWQNAQSGELYTWLMDGTSINPISSINYLYTVGDSNWKIKTIADFDGDKNADILWRHAVTGEIKIWRMNGTAIASEASFDFVSDLDWRIR